MAKQCWSDIDEIERVHHLNHIQLVLCKTASFSISLPSPSKCIDDDDGGADNDVVGGGDGELHQCNVGDPKQYGGWGPTRGCQKWRNLGGGTVGS